MTGFGVRVHPSGAKAFLVNYRAGNGGRKTPNKRVVVGGGAGLEAGRKEGKSLQFDVHVEQLYFRFESLFLHGITFRPT